MKLEKTKVSLLALSACFIFTYQSGLAQNVGINSDGSTPGMTLDVKPTGASDGVRINNANAGDGDPIIDMQIDGTSEFTIGVDDSDLNRFKIDNGGALGTSPILSIEAGGDVGINTNNPDNDLDVTGDAQISSYLLVGSPGVPSAVAGARANLFKSTLNQMDGGIETENPCGSSFWQFTYTDNTLKNYLLFDNDGAANSISYAYSPWMWVPTGAGTVQVLLEMESDLESEYDGVYAEMYIGGAWTKLTDAQIVFGTKYTGNTPNTTVGTNGTCTGAATTLAWTGSTFDAVGAIGFGISIFDVPGLAGNWTRFRLVGMEDGSNSDGTGFRLYSMSFDVDFPAFGGGAFAAGNIYAENNIYAGSNVMLGDLAEYFPLVGKAEAGDVISMIDGSGERYMKSISAYDAKAIGIYSSNPTLTLNDPNSGVPVGLQGRVPVKVTNENGPIKKGDYLTTAFTSGHAMKADRACYIVGRALEDFDGTEGKILCLIETGCYNPVGSVAGSVTSGGVFKVPAVTKSITVVDPTVKKDSRILVTMLEDPGHRYWVSNVQDGSYDINFSGTNAYAVPFNYLVDNASAEAALQAEANTVEPVAPVVAGSVNDRSAYVWDKKTHKCYFNGEEVDASKVPNFDAPVNGRAVSLPPVSHELPPTVDDETKGYTWSVTTGLVPSEATGGK